MKKFLCYDTNDAASGKINVDNRGMLKPNSTVPSTNGAAYKQLVTDGNGNTKWEDRTHWVEDGFSIAWDGDTTGHNNIDIGTILGRGEGTLMYKVHDKYIPPESIIGSYIGMNIMAMAMASDSADGFTVDETHIYSIGDDGFYVSKNEIPCVVVFNDDSQYGAGVYFLLVEGYVYISSVSKQEVIHPLHKKFLPTEAIRTAEITVSNTPETVITWDGITDGLDSFYFNAFNYYKLSDLLPGKNAFIGTKQTLSSGMTQILKESSIYADANVLEAGYVYVVYKSGSVGIPLGNGFKTVTVPSAGIYGIKRTNDYVSNIPLLEASLVRKGIIVPSNTEGSSKEFLLTVDDSGTISATEVTS